MKPSISFLQRFMQAGFEIIDNHAYLFDSLIFVNLEYNTIFDDGKNNNRS